MLVEDIYLKILRERRIKIEKIIEETGISRDVLNNYLERIIDFIEQDVSTTEYVELKDPLGLAEYLLRMGIPYKKVSRYLDWRDFELFALRILSAYRYEVYHNFRLTRPVRLEIDVIGIDPGSGLGVFVDCKHWIHGVHRQALIEYAEKQYSRVVKLVKYLSWAKTRWRMLGKLRRAVPMIVTLTTPRIRMHHNVLIVSIQELNQVLRDLDYVIDVFGIETIRV